MTSWSLACLIIAVLAALLGFAGITGTMAIIAKTFFAIFLFLFAVLLMSSRNNLKNNNPHRQKEKGREI